MAHARWLEALSRIGTPDFTEQDVKVLSRSFRAIYSFIGLDKQTRYSGGFILITQRSSRCSFFEEAWVIFKFSFFLQALRRLSRKDYLIWKAYYIWKLSMLEIYREFIRRRGSIENGESIVSRRLSNIRKKLAGILRGE